MTRKSPALAFAVALAGATAAVPVHADVDSERQAGDVLSLALPLGTLLVELGRGDREGAWQFTKSFVVTMGATEVLKRTTNVERPDGSDDESFPSGHASRAYSAAAYVHRRHGIESAWPLYAAATYVGYTRVAADRHRWIDIAGSAAVSIASAWWLVEPAGARVSAAVAGDGVRLSLQWPL